MQKNFNTLGAMIDCSRNAVMNLAEIERFIKLLAKMGYNQLQLYIEDTYEVDNEEFFGYKRGRYSQEELKEIVKIAEENGIEAVPCMQTLAHLKTINRWKKYEQMMDTGDTLLVGDDGVYELIENMFASLRKCFKTDKIHIGMDEAVNLGTGKYRELHGERDRGDILLEHLNKVCVLAEKYNFKPMMWSDMFYRIANGGEYYSTETEFSADIKEKIPENVTLVYWDYYHIKQEFYDGMLKGHKKLTDNLAFAGGAWKWNGFVPHNQLGVPATKSALTSCIKNGVKDVFITLWGDDGAEASVYGVLPSICTAACINIGIYDDEGIKQKFKEWTGADYDAFMTLDLPDFVEGVNPEHVINQAKFHLYNDCLLGIYDGGAVSEGDNKHYEETSAKIKAAKEKAGDYGYLFDTIGTLCDILKIKAELGIKTRKAYKENNREELQSIVNDYDEMIKNTEKFYDVFRTQWYKENKSYGFEVQDMRLGGLIMRMKNCRKMLESYLCGEVSSVLELEEETLKVKEEKDVIYRWEEIITANVI